MSLIAYIAHATKERFKWMHLMFSKHKHVLERFPSLVHQYIITVSTEGALSCN